MRKLMIESDFDTVGSGLRSTMAIARTDHLWALSIAFYKGAFTLMSKAEVLADIKSVQFEVQKNDVGNIELVDISIEKLYEFIEWHNQEHSAYTSTGHVILPFTREDMPANNAAKTLGIGVADLSRIALSVNYKTNAGFVCTKVSVKRDVEAGVMLNLGTYPILKEEQRSLGTAGTGKLIRDLPDKISGAVYLSMHLDDGVGTIDRIKHLKLGSHKVVEDFTAADHLALSHLAKKKPQTGIWSLDFLRDKNGLPIGNNAAIELSVDYSVAPGAYSVLTDILYDVDAI